MDEEGRVPASHYRPPYHRQQRVVDHTTGSRRWLTIPQAAEEGSTALSPWSILLLRCNASSAAATACEPTTGTLLIHRPASPPQSCSRAHPPAPEYGNAIDAVYSARRWLANETSAKQVQKAVAVLCWCADGISLLQQNTATALSDARLAPTADGCVKSPRRVVRGGS